MNSKCLWSLIALSGEAGRICLVCTEKAKLSNANAKTKMDWEKSRDLQLHPSYNFQGKHLNNPYTLGATTWSNLGKLGGHFTHQDNFITTIHEGFGNLTSGSCEKVWRVAKGQWFDFTLSGRKCGLTRRLVIHKSTVCTHLTHKVTDYGIYNNHLRVLCSALIQILISLGQESHPIDKNQSVHQYLVAQSCAQKSIIKE